MFVGGNTVSVLLLVDCVHENVITFILPFNSKILDFPGRSFNLTLFYGRTGLQEDLGYLLPFLKNFLSRVLPYDGVTKVLQVFQSLTLFQCILDQPMADGGTVLPESVPGVLHTPLGKGKLLQEEWRKTHCQHQ